MAAVVQATRVPAVLRQVARFASFPAQPNGNGRKSECSGRLRRPGKNAHDLESRRCRCIDLEATVGRG